MGGVSTSPTSKEKPMRLLTIAIVGCSPPIDTKPAHFSENSDFRHLGNVGWEL
jgi:hypothetical protein